MFTADKGIDSHNHVSQTHIIAGEIRVIIILSLSIFGKKLLELQ